MKRIEAEVGLIAKMGDCLKELDETDYWLDLLTASEIVPAARLSALQDECNQPTAIFTTIIKKTKLGSS